MKEFSNLHLLFYAVLIPNLYCVDRVEGHEMSRQAMQAVRTGVNEFWFRLNRMRPLGRTVGPKRRRVRTGNANKKGGVRRVVVVRGGGGGAKPNGNTGSGAVTVAYEPSTIEQTTMEPGTNEPSTIEQGTNEQGTNEPASNAPATTEPATIEPTTSEPEETFPPGHQEAILTIAAFCVPSEKVLADDQNSLYECMNDEETGERAAFMDEFEVCVNDDTNSCDSESMDTLQNCVTGMDNVTVPEKNVECMQTGLTEKTLTAIKSEYPVLFGAPEPPLASGSAKKSKNKTNLKKKLHTPPKTTNNKKKQGQGQGQKQGQAKGQGQGQGKAKANKPKNG